MELSSNIMTNTRGNYELLNQSNHSIHDQGIIDMENPHGNVNSSPLSETYQSSGGDHDPHPQNTSNNLNQNPSKYSFLLQLLFFLLIGFMIRNMFYHDYDEESKAYLKKIGRSDLIDSMVPSSSSELLTQRQINDKILQYERNFTSLYSAVMLLQQQVESLNASNILLTSELNKLKDSIDKPQIL